jgi:hypothetical protein
MATTKAERRERLQSTKDDLAKLEASEATLESDLYASLADRVSAVLSEVYELDQALKTVDHFRRRRRA